MKRIAYFPVLAVASLSLLPMVTGCSKLQARDQLNKGVQAYKNARFEEAIDHFQNAERLDPTLQMAPLYLATAYAQQVVPDANTPENLKNAELAVNAYQQVLTKDPNDLNALKGIAAVYLNTGKTDGGQGMADKGYRRSIRMIRLPITRSASSIGGLPTGMRSRRGPASACRIMATRSRTRLHARSWQSRTRPLVDEGIKSLQQAINLRPGYDDAMSYLSLLYRRKADLDCGDDAARKQDMAMFDQWRDKTMATRKAER